MKLVSLSLGLAPALALLLALAGLSGCGHTPAAYVSTQTIPEGARVVHPRLLETVAPLYPHEMRRSGLEQIVQIEAVVLANGTVHSAIALEGHGSDFAVEAVRAVNQWIFQPGTINEVASPMKVLIPVAFTLDGEKSAPLTAKL